MAARLTRTKAPLRRSLFSWMYAATTSLPTPLSPMSSADDDGVAATRAARASTSCIAALRATAAVRSFCCSSSTASLRRIDAFSSACSRRAPRSSRSSGLAQVVGRAAADGRDRAMDLGPRGHRDDDRRRIELQRAIEDVEAVAVGQVEVEEHGVERLRRERARRGRDVRQRSRSGDPRVSTKYLSVDVTIGSSSTTSTGKSEGFIPSRN